MINSIRQTATLHNGVQMPWLGLGVYKTQDGQEVRQAIRHALDVGYRSIDTATYYQNETGVGQAVRESGLPREAIFVTSKVWNNDQGYERTLAAFEQSMHLLGFDYLDLYLIHWPVPGKFIDTWRALETLYRQERVRAIGVSNFMIPHLEELLAVADIKPMVNQVEFHPRLVQADLLAFCQARDIQMEAWSPILRGRIFSDPVIVSLAEKYGKTPAQIVLRWDLEHRVITIPKSVHRHRIEENAGIFDFSLSAEDVALIDGLETGQRVGPDPFHVNF